MSSRYAFAEQSFGIWSSLLGYMHSKLWSEYRLLVCCWLRYAAGRVLICSVMTSVPAKTQYRIAEVAACCDLATVLPVPECKLSHCCQNSVHLLPGQQRPQVGWWRWRLVPDCLWGWLSGLQGSVFNVYLPWLAPILCCIFSCHVSWLLQYRIWLWL